MKIIQHNLFFFTASVCFDSNSDLHQPALYNERLCKPAVSGIAAIFQKLTLAEVSLLCVFFFLNNMLQIRPISNYYE